MSILEKFTVIDLIKTRSASVATITGHMMKFNNQTAAELHYTSHIQVLIYPKGKQFAIRACKEDAPNSLRFSKPDGEQKNPIKITAAAVVDMIRKMANWSTEETWNIPGIYFADEDALIYDLNTAYKPSQAGGWAIKRQTQNAVAAALSGMIDDTEKCNS